MFGSITSSCSWWLDSTWIIRSYSCTGQASKVNVFAFAFHSHLSVPSHCAACRISLSAQYSHIQTMTLNFTWMYAVIVAIVGVAISHFAKTLQLQFLQSVCKLQIDEKVFIFRNFSQFPALVFYLEDSLWRGTKFQFNTEHLSPQLWWLI